MVRKKKMRVHSPFGQELRWIGGEKVRRSSGEGKTLSWLGTLSFSKHEKEKGKEKSYLYIES